MTAYLVGGTQAELGKQNHIILMKMHQLHSTLKESNKGIMITAVVCDE